MNFASRNNSHDVDFGCRESALQRLKRVGRDPGRLPAVQFAHHAKAERSHLEKTEEREFSPKKREFAFPVETE